MRLRHRNLPSLAVITRMKELISDKWATHAQYITRGRNKGRLAPQRTAKAFYDNEPFLQATTRTHVLVMVLDEGHRRGETTCKRGMRRGLPDEKLPGMEFLPEQQDLLFKPAVYRIVCRPTGRYYIGSSQKPWMRRAVHLFWLKNITIFTQPNVFCTYKELKEDLAAHGPESFYQEILVSMPGATRQELLAEETRLLQEADPKLVYNRFLGDGFQETSQADTLLKELFPEFKVLREQLTSMRARLAHLNATLVLRERSRERRALKKEIPILSKQVMKLRKQLFAIIENTDLRNYK